MMSNVTPNGHDSKLYRREGRRFVAAEKAGEKDGPINNPIITNVLEVMRSFFVSPYRILYNSDTAYRRDRQLQRMMRHDPDVMAPLLQRQMAVALLEWDIEPADPDDDRQVEMAKQIRLAIADNMRRRHEFLLELLEAVWYGPSAVNVIYHRRGGLIVPVAWKPWVHPDSVSFDVDGRLGFRVNMVEFKGEKVFGINGPVHLLEEVERRAVVLHVHHPTAPDYEVPYDAAYVYAGRGLRDIAWYFWLMKQKSLQYFTQWMERYALGNRIGYYEEGNNEQEEALKTALQNLYADVSITLPQSSVTKDSQNPLPRIDMVESNSPEGAKTVLGIIEGYFAGQIKELIIGQSATTEAVSTGLGSKVGEAHEETFHRIVTMDAMNLADTLTAEFVRPLTEMNFGDDAPQLRWVFRTERVNPVEWMESIEKAVNLGLDVAVDEARDVLGTRVPKPGEATLQPTAGIEAQYEPGDDAFATAGKIAAMAMKMRDQ